ncbi:violaxanthin deepoxidase-related, chloroplast precursor [Nitzschia inconspicua]|uniref:Violaxanthin deepoxidase-related, chloroplast n=1 Tax=Nitzschia inconspicua TaxID=303405 RepID=A0A9K3LFP5_9STRA|nr:violaxanthin deepoxidase-related, chloroplast precursor [Nitzschia inconspicua]
MRVRGDVTFTVFVIVSLVVLPPSDMTLKFEDPSSLGLVRLSIDTATYSESKSYPEFYVLDPQEYRSCFPTDHSFELAKRTAPFLDLPKVIYQDVLTAYYYRIRSYRNHIRKTDDDRFWIVTEFLPKVPWSGPFNTISAAAGHHILEGRWFWDAPEFVEDYVRFWYLGGGVSTSDNPKPQPHIATYTHWIYHATLRYALLWGVQQPSIRELLQRTLPQAADLFRNVYIDKYLTNSSRNAPYWNTTKRVCWRQDDGYDAMEVSVSGNGCRPTIAAVIWGEAQALVDAAALMRNSDVKFSDGSLQAVIHEFSNWAAFSKQVILRQHWNFAMESFAVIPPPKGGMTASSTRHRKTEQQQQQQRCDLQQIRVPNHLVNIRELLAFMPWYFPSMLKELDLNITSYARQFRWLLESTGENGFSAKWGLRTVQRNTPCYNYSWEHGDCWNGLSWPYETSRVLTAVSNLLSDHSNETVIASGMTPSIFEGLFLQYARQHTQTFADNDTAIPTGSGHIFENVHPDLGYWNNRALMYWRNDPNKNMGDDYNHSTFLDLVFGSWLGIRLLMGPSSPWLSMNPLIQAPYFAVDRIPYKGRVLSVVYDPSGNRYVANGMRLKGFVILLEGRVVANQPDIGTIVIETEPSFGVK